MLLEEIPVEMYLEIFKYLDVINLYGFYNLNKKTNLILSQAHLYFNFDDNIDNRFASRLYAFDELQIYYFSLSGSAINIFCSMFTLTQFNNLRTLKLLQIPIPNLRRFTSELLMLKRLTQLHVEPTFHSDESYDCNRILQHSTLKICYLKSSFEKRLYFSMPLMSNSSIEHLTLDVCCLDDVYLFLQHMPKLKRLIMIVHATGNDKGINRKNITELITPNLVYFKLIIKGSMEEDVEIFEPLKELLMLLPKLVYFEFTSFACRFRDGYWWEKVLCELIYLKTFRCSVCVWKAYRGKNLAQYGEKFVESFQTSFWLKKTQRMENKF
ncbi:unnamed protein product [Didymodactylos carnosus]|uniref:F-box domain-containing protein n=1 Tax=Didymodactylos carnosus TaxID=1234261 RepID=A0A815ZIV3_9BILA|nr:unnamed protein product [Didymodactylos carnosus]CAF4455295.1 unnamed protein product [Didymodactylos carnosus]